MIKVKEFYIEKSEWNPQLSILIAVGEDGTKWIVSGDHWNPPYLQQYEGSCHTNKKIIKK